MSSTADRPNLFRYAPSELSQDAFICWLVAWAADGAHPLGHIGRAFIGLLQELGGTAVADASTIQLVPGSLRPQHHKIDVYFRAQVDGKRVSFIIEDKTDTTAHSNQLERYRNAIENDGFNEDLVVSVYLKTGFLYDEEHDHAKAHGYGILDAKTLHGFLRRYEPNSDIYRDFVEHLYTRFVVPQREAFPALMRGELASLQRPDVQWQYAEKLRRRLIESVPGHLQTGQWKVGPSDRGTSMGRPWTHVIVASYRVGDDDDSLIENLFYRIDRRKKGYYVALRQWAPVKGRALEAKQAKLERLRNYRAAADPKRLPTALELGRATTDNSGNQESEILVIFLDKERNTPKAVLEHLPALHTAWRTALGQDS